MVARRPLGTLVARLREVPSVVAGLLAEERPRFINWLPVMLGVGMAAYFALPQEPEFAATLLPLATGLVMWGASRRHFALLIVAGTLIVGGTGFLIAKLRTMWVAAPVLEHSLRSAEVTGCWKNLSRMQTRSPVDAAHHGD